LSVVNPFTAISREEHQRLERLVLSQTRELEDKQREIAALAQQLEREMNNAERLTRLCGRAMASLEIVEAALVERQIGAKRDPAMVLVVNNLPDPPKRHRGFMPLHKRRREAAKKEAAQQTRRSALPKLEAELPDLPLTKEDREAMRAVIAESSETI